MLSSPVGVFAVDSAFPAETTIPPVGVNPNPLSTIGVESVLVANPSTRYEPPFNASTCE